MLLYATKSRGAFRTQTNVKDGAFCKKPLVTFTKSFILDV